MDQDLGAPKEAPTQRRFAWPNIAGGDPRPASAADIARYLFVISVALMRPSLGAGRDGPRAPCRGDGDVIEHTVVASDDDERLVAHNGGPLEGAVIRRGSPGPAVAPSGAASTSNIAYTANRRHSIIGGTSGRSAIGK
jgi:hypothetical protein